MVFTEVTAARQIPPPRQYCGDGEEVTAVIVDPSSSAMATHCVSALRLSFKGDAPRGTFL